MKKSRMVMLVVAGCLIAGAISLVGSYRAEAAEGGNVAVASRLFDNLTTEPDVVYLIANSSVVFGPDPHGRSEEVTFVGPVTVPKWPMKGYGRRVLPDGRQQIDIELTQSELTGESYVLHGPVVLGEHPDLRSLGTITERPRGAALASNEVPGPGVDRAARDQDKSADKGKPEAAAPGRETAKEKTAGAPEPKPRASLQGIPPAEEVPADFVVERKVLMTTAKGILYNETAVPVRGRIDSIPPIKMQRTPTGVNTFRGMELPVALLDKEGNVNGWFYSKAHMAYAVLPAAIQRSFIAGTLQLRSGDKTETVEVSGPAEIHHLGPPCTDGTATVEVMVLALRGHSALLGGDVMVAETFSDRDHFSRGEVNWSGSRATGSIDLFVDVYTPSAKLATNVPLRVTGEFTDEKASAHLHKAKLDLPMVTGRAHFTSDVARSLYDEAEKPVVQITSLDLNMADGR